MRHRRLAVLLAAVSVAGLAATGCGSTSAAIQVEDQSISRRDFEASLDFVYENESWRSWLSGGEPVSTEGLRPEDAPPGVYTQRFVGGLASAHVQFLVAEQLVRDLDLPVSDDDRDAAEDDLAGEIDGGWDAVPEDLRDDYRNGWAALTVLQDQPDTDAVNEAAQEMLDGGNITVSSRYGSWDRDDFTVVPPAGPRQAPGSASGADGSDLPAG